MQSKIVIYTAIFGKFDEVKYPKKLPVGIDYYIFTDQNLELPNHINIVRIDNVSDTRLEARRLKLQPHKIFSDYEFSIWIDGSIKLLKPFEIKNCVYNALKDNDFAAFKHMHRKTLQEELKSCLKRKKDNPYIMLTQYNDYISAGYKPELLIESGVLIRRHNSPKCAKFCDAWWNNVLKYSIRDQLSFPFVKWQTKFKIKTLEGYIWENKHFKVEQHNTTSSKYFSIDTRIGFRKNLKYLYDYFRWILKSYTNRKDF